MPDIVYMGTQFTGTREITIMPEEDTCKKEYKLSKEKFINVCNKAWRRGFLNENKIVFPEHVIYEDVVFSFWGISRAKTFAIGDFIFNLYLSGRPGSVTTKKQLKQSKDTIECIENLIKLKDIIEEEHIPFLLERIKEQQERLGVRLERVIKDAFNEM